MYLCQYVCGYTISIDAVCALSQLINVDAGFREAWMSNPSCVLRTLGKEVKKPVMFEDFDALKTALKSGEVSGREQPYAVVLMNV